jgi:hypothetical protein
MGRKTSKIDREGGKRWDGSWRLLEASGGSERPLGGTWQDGADREGERGQDKGQPGSATLALTNQRLATRQGQILPADERQASCFQRLRTRHNTVAARESSHPAGPLQPVTRDVVQCTGGQKAPCRMGEYRAVCT